ncbi:replication primase [Phenylobacterium zucineum HLK1]|uniref:Replication primase n=1 Tax=Phenylobacterium zucineum (strain HLK1) TaxID=450851 RepID=B4RAA3_PHEZH|nr:zincin-like metallopeptidase domain-containing protein [Phenylobacterium zucineum]ACG77910.1 replication primase [Phenylobacterium zucineum HLK1]
MPSHRADIYARITGEIVAAIEAGAGEFRMPWHHDGAATSRPVNVASSRPYRGVNILALWIAAREAGYPSGLWGTYRQWLALGAQVRKGEHATSIVLWKTLRPAGGDEGDEPEAPGGRTRMFARGYAVFNLAQVDGYAPAASPQLPESERLAHAEAFWSRLGIVTVYGGSEAYYLPSKDTVFMPPFSAFHDAGAHYSTLYHEGVHATAARHRCNRDLSGRFGSEAYAMEEVVADLGSALILADLGIAVHPRPDHAAYIASWLKVLKNDTSAIFTAASKAQAAADWMHAQQPAAQADVAA